uniref:Predicted protein n=1 Tax=Physcomitrium patens TaxID=3218 RepID=A9U6H0_PHYPA
MENENKKFEGSLGGVSGGGSSKGQGMHMDPSIASMFQAFSLSMQQQESNDRKEALATKALQAVVNKIDQFDGRNISRYLRCYVREMELNRVFEKKMVELFGLAMISEIRDHITSIMDRYRNSWEVFSHALKDEYFLEDVHRITKKLFLEWIERPNKNLQATRLLREFERQYSQLSKVEKLTLEPNKVDLFLQAADEKLQGKLELLLEDKEEDEGLTTKVDDEIGGSTKTSEFWASAVSTMQEGKLPREALLRTAATIRGRTGWKNPVESLSVHAYIAKSQHEALMEEKRQGNFDDTRERNSSKRQTRGDKAWEAALQELPVKDTSASLGEKTKETKEKGKSITYKLLSDIEAATNLKGVLEERILNAKVEFTLKEVLEITKKEFHDIIIDSIKRKRQLMGETGMSHAIDAKIYKEEEEVDIGYKQPTNEKYGYNQRARATTEILVKVGDIEKPIVALVDHGSEINLMSKDLYKKQKWPIDMEHGWAIRTANNTRGELYGACPDVKIWIGDLATEQHFFVQDTTSYPLILGQPYIMATWMETKVLDDGSAYARRDYGGTKEEVLSRDEGAFDASFIGILKNGNIMYKKVDDFKRKERKRLYDIEGQLHKLENGLEDSLELITSIELGDNDKIVEIHSREVYTILESFQAPEVTVETRYKMADKKVKPIAGPLPEDSKEQMGEASKEASLRDPMSWTLVY